MAGEKITLEVVSKLVDKGFKLAKQQIEQIRKLEQKRFKQNVLQDTRALIAAKGNYKEEQRIISRMEDTDRKNTINRIRRARQLTNIKISGIKKTEKAFNDLFRKQRQALKEIKRRSGFDSNIYTRKQKLAIKTAEAERRAARHTAKTLRRLDQMTKAQKERREKIALARTKKTEQKIRNEARRTAQVRRQALGSIKQGYSSIIGTLGKLTVAAGIAGYALASAAKKVLSVGAGFEQSIANVGAIANLTDQQMSRIGNKARELGAQTAYTATEVANGMADLARAGLEVDKIMGAIGPTLYLAGAAGADLGQATKLMARTMAQFGLEASDATNVADTFTLAMQNSLLDIESLDSSMRYAGAAAGAFDWDIQQTTAAVALFMDQTGMGSTAGTQFRHVLLSLAGPTREAKNVIKELAEAQDLTYKQMRNNLNPATSDFKTIMESLKPVMKDHDKILKLVNKRSSGTLQKILKDYHSEKSKFGALTSLFATSSGAAISTYDRQMSTVQGKAKIVNSKIQESFLQLFDAMKGPISGFLDSAMKGMDDIILVFEAGASHINNLFHTAFGGMNRAAQTTGETIAIVIVRIIEKVLWLVRNLPILWRETKKWAKFLFQAWVAIKGLFVLSALISIIQNIIKLTGVLTAKLKAMTIAGRAASLSFAGLGIGLLAWGATELLGSMTSGMEDLSSATDTTTGYLETQTEALRRAKQEYENALTLMGGGSASGATQSILRVSTQRMLESDFGSDDRIRKSVVKEYGLSEKEISEKIDKGELIDIESDLIPKDARAKLKEMTGGMEDFKVSLETVYATVLKMGDAETKQFIKNVNKKALSMQNLKEATSALEEIGDTPFPYMEETKRIIGLPSEFEKAGRFVDQDFDAISSGTLESELMTQQLLANRDAMKDLLTQDPAGFENVVKLMSDATQINKEFGSMKLEPIEIKAVGKALEKLNEDQGSLVDSSATIFNALKGLSNETDAVLEEKSRLMANQLGLLNQNSDQIRQTVEKTIKISGRSDFAAAALGGSEEREAFVEKQGYGGYAKVEEEAYKVMEGEDRPELVIGGTELPEMIDMLGQVRKELEGVETGYGDAFSILFGDHQFEELRDGTRSFLNDEMKLTLSQNEKIKLLLYQRHVQPLKKAYDEMAKTNIPVEQLDRFKDAWTRTLVLVNDEAKRIAGTTTEDFAYGMSSATIGEAFKTDKTAGNIIGELFASAKDQAKKAGAILNTLNDVLKERVEDEEEADASRDERNKAYMNKLKAFYKKLFQMEKSQQQRLDKIREDESDSLANALKRRLDKTREFFEEGYRLLRNNTSRTIALRRREERLLNQIRLEERIKLAKAAQKELEQVEGEIFKLEKTPYQQAVEKSRKDRLKAQEDFQKAINLVVETGSKKRLEQVQRDSDKLRDITSKAIVGKDGKIKRYAPKVSSLNFARIGEPEYKKDTKKEDKKSRQQIFDDLLARRRQALLDNDKEGLKGINKEYQEQIKLQEESLKITNLYAALLEKRYISGKKIGKKDMGEFEEAFPGLNSKTIKDATRVVNAMGKKGIAEARDIANKSAGVRQSINSRNVMSFNNAEKDMTEALETETQLRGEKVRKAGLELAKWKEDNIYKPLEIMEKDITAVFETTQGDQTKREREEIKKRLEEQLGGYDKALEELKVYDRKRRAIATKAMMDSDLGFDLRDDMSPMNASWWKTRRMELENELLSGPSLNSLFQRAFDVEMKALDTRTPEGAKERLLAEAESLRALAKLYREHEEEKRSIIKEYRLDEDDVSEEDLRIGQKQLALVTERQKKEMDAAKKAAKDAAAGIAHYFKVAGEKIGAVFNSAFGPIYAVYQFFQNILDITSSLIGKIKSGIDFFTGGNLELNPFTLMTEAANELLAHMDEIIEKQKALDEQYQAGRISQDEYKKNQEVLNLEKKNARAVAKETVDKMIDESIRFMDALIKVAPMIIEQLIKRLPEIMEALRKMVPMLGKIVDELFPVLVPVLTKLFTLAAKIFFQVLSELLFGGFMGNKKVSKKPGKKAVKAGTVLAPTSTGDDEIYKPRLFGDTPGPMKVMSSGFKKYGDTPGPVRVTNSGLLARFAPGDTVIAAKEPQEVMRQALMAVGSDIKMGVTKPPPMPSSATQGGSAGGSSRIDIAVIAEGRVLDAVQMQAMDRGHAPKIAKRLRKASGVKVGFNRGRYNKFAVNES